MSAGPLSRSTLDRAKTGGPVLASPRGSRRGLLGEPPFPLQHPPGCGKAEHAFLRLSPQGAEEKAVTLQLLWEEYRENNPEGYQYSQFCLRYRAWLKTLESPFARTTRREKSSSSIMPATRSRSTIPRPERSPRLSLCRHPGGEQLHLCGGGPLPGAPFLDQLPCPYLRVHGSCSRDRGPGQSHNRRDPSLPVRARPQSDVPGHGHTTAPRSSPRG